MVYSEKNALKQLQSRVVCFFIITERISQHKTFFCNKWTTSSLWVRFTHQKKIWKYNIDANKFPFLQSITTQLFGYPTHYYIYLSVQKGCQKACCKSRSTWYQFPDSFVVFSWLILFPQNICVDRQLVHALVGIRIDSISRYKWIFPHTEK